MITAIVLGGVNIFGGSGTMAGVLIALLVLAFVQNALGLPMALSDERIIEGLTMAHRPPIMREGVSAARSSLVTAESARSAQL